MHKEGYTMKHINTLSLVSFFTVLSIPFSTHATAWFSCQADEVMEFSDRIHVRCSNPLSISYRGTNSNVRYIAITKDDTAKANRFTSVAPTSVISGRTFRVEIEENSEAHNVAGCRPSDCRTPTAFGIQE